MAEVLTVTEKIGDEIAKTQFVWVTDKNVAYRVDGIQLAVYVGVENIDALKKMKIYRALAEMKSVVSIAMEEEIPLDHVIAGLPNLGR